MQIQQIALDKLVPAKAPVRHTNGAKGKTNIEELAASIAAHGLLQNLVVSPSGKKFQVIAGNHRLAALELLAKKKGSGITGASKIPCRVVAEDGQGHAIAENVVRAPLHFIDEAEAFADLVHQGMEPAKVAGMFAWTEKKVRQMHALGMLPQPIRDSARAGEIGLDACKAYTLFGVDAPGKAGVDNGKRAFECWKTLRRQADHNNSQMIRRVAREATVPIAHALFDPTQHQDQIATDLFGDNAAFRDVAKFWALQNQAIEAEAQRLKAIGWSDVLVIRDQKERNNIWRDWDFLEGQLDTATEKKIAKLAAEEQAIENKEEWGEEDNDRLDAIRGEIDKLRAANQTYTDRQMKKRSALILVDERSGEVEIKLGALNRKEAEKAQAAKARKKQADIEDVVDEESEEAEGHRDGLDAARERDAKPDRSYPRNVLAELYVQKSFLLQDAVSQSPKAALVWAIWQALREDSFQGPLQLMGHPSRNLLGADEQEVPAANTPIARKVRNALDLPFELGLRQIIPDQVPNEEDYDLYGRLRVDMQDPVTDADISRRLVEGLLDLNVDALAKIFAAVVSRGVGYHEPTAHTDPAQVDQGMDVLMRALIVDTRAAWQPSEAFFSRLPRKTLLSIAGEVFDADFLKEWRKAKPAELAKAIAERWVWTDATAAEQLRRDAWVPPALRCEDAAAVEPMKEAAQ